MKKLSYFLIVLSAVCWGTIGIFTRTVTEAGFSALEMLFVKVVMGACFLSAWFMIKDKSLFKLKTPKDILYFIGTGICSFVFFSWCYIQSINLTSIGIAVVFLYTAPVFVMIMSVFLFHEKMTLRKVVVLLLTFSGCVLVTGLLESVGGTITLLGVMLGLGSGFGYALYSIFGTFALKRGYRSLTITYYTFLTAAIFMLFLLNPIDIAQRISDTHLWLYMVVFTAVTTVIPYVAYTTGLAYIEAGKASVMATIEPVVAVGIGILFFQESASIMKLLGIVMVLSSVFLLRDKKTEDLPKDDMDNSDKVASTE
ncbi:MAG: EamA family transporter [Epulopiscium sp.]|jgi:DME family drug/metabolite transporter|nr:EamA family transporter [Candidatus Epulonipiscium sp.]